MFLIFYFKMKELKMARTGRPSTWTPLEEKYIIEHADHLSDTDMSVELTEWTGEYVSVKAVRVKRRSLGLMKGHGNGHIHVVRDLNKEGREAAVVPHRED
jgi:hypothetical protein